ncbi:integrator complex subunit 8 [Frankliniella occidentalis]|uniref:Integrator complex subunit 8 n=1 Tax=Frankliniella occidentalis TaxID=133901 RepID=A0A6J1SSX6_FRAOC|nr:integrator complex subunit 8 [Frankliniella occidentalis]
MELLNNQPAGQPDTVLWFVFLLDPDSLETHLKQDDADPTPTELICKFLTNSQALNEAAPRSRKNLALKILSLKVAAHLKWDMSILLERLPLNMQYILLKDLLYMSRQEEADPSTDTSLDFNEVSPQTLFSVVLFHRWVLCALVKQNISFNSTQNGNSNLNTGRTPAGVAPNGAASSEISPEDVLRLLEKQAPGSVDVLHRAVASQPPSISIPTFKTFKPLTEDNGDIDLLWDTCEQLTLDEFRCQLHYDLGVYFMFKQEITIAREHFTSCDLLLSQCTGMSIYRSVSRVKLDGYRIACGVYTPPSQSALLCQFHASIKQHYMGIVNILVQDNKSLEIPMVHREHLELDIQGAVQSGTFTVARDLLIQIQCLNVARRLMGGHLICQDYSHHIRVAGPKGADFLLSFLKPLLSESTNLAFKSDDIARKFRVKTFLRGLLEAGNQSALVKAIFDSPEFGALFEPNELSQLSGKSVDISIPAMLSSSSWDIPDLGPRRNPRLEMGALEQQLIQSYDPEEIRQLLSKLSSMPSVKSQGKAIWHVNSKWELPIPVHSVVMNLPKGFVQEFCYILLAKAHELASVQEYSLALRMYAIVEEELRKGHSIPSVVKLIRLCGWEALVVEITQFLDEWPAHNSRSIELAEACKACLSARQAGEALIPRLEVVERCVVMLLNVSPSLSSVGSPLDFLTKLDRHCVHVELAAAFAYACQDIIRQKGGRHVSRDAWDLVLPVFLRETTKRTSSGIPIHHSHRDSPVSSGGLNSSTLWAFLSQLRDPTMITLALSLLARIHNVLRDDSKFDINVDYVNLWPASISGPNSYASKGVAEMLYQLLAHALKYNPIHVGWLKVQGDLNFVMNHLSSALKSYLEAAIAATDFFSQPLQRMQIDDHVIRRMIKCCSLLQCHTQAAVLCQFLEEIDYTTAFKCIGETKGGSCADAMDSYYECVWDTTLLEYLIHLHTKRGETHRKQLAIQTIGLLELNSNNNEEIQREAVNIRKAKFLRALAHQYVC